MNSQRLQNICTRLNPHASARGTNAASRAAALGVRLHRIAFLTAAELAELERHCDRIEQGFECVEHALMDLEVCADGKKQ